MTTITTPCQLDPYLWDVDHRMTWADIAACIDACNTCPALGRCRTYLADLDANQVEIHGVIAGQYRPYPTPGRPATRPCGTPAAYYRHLRHGEQVDPLCRSAIRDQAAKHRRARKRARTRAAS
jgi:hypothetical protein